MLRNPSNKTSIDKKRLKTFVRILNARARNVLYSTSLEECELRGLLHRSVAIILMNSPVEILPQQRSFSDDWLPGNGPRLPPDMQKQANHLRTLQPGN
jgi:hypothetical protein